MLSKASYAYMSITGDNYCESGKSGFLLFFKHLFNLIQVDLLIGAITWCGMATIVGLTSVMAIVTTSLMLPNTLTFDQMVWVTVCVSFFNFFTSQ